MSAYTKSKVDLAKEQELHASAQEKIAKIGLDQATAEHKMAEADYALVKLMLELESMDMDTLAKSFELAQNIKMANNPELQQRPKEAV
jgi:hypothetical protein